MMKITINKKELQGALKDLKKVSINKNIPILNYFLLESKNNETFITFSNTELTIRKKVNANIISEGSLLLDLKKLDTVLKKIKTTEIEIAQDETTVTLLSGSNKFNYKTPIASQYPKIKVQDNGFRIYKKELESLFSSVLYAAGKQESRPILTGVNTVITDDKIVATTCDSHRLATKEIPINTGENYTANINAASLVKVLKMDLDNVMAFSYSDTFVQLEGEKTMIQIKKVEGLFPDTSRLIPQDNSTALSVSKKELIESIELGQVFSSDSKNNVVGLETTQEKTTITADDYPATFVSELKTVEQNGEPLKISFNPSYVLDTLKNIDSDMINIKLTSSVRPFTVQGNDDSTLHLITPIRTR